LLAMLEWVAQMIQIKAGHKVGAEGENRQKIERHTSLGPGSGPWTRGWRLYTCAVPN